MEILLNFTLYISIGASLLLSFLLITNPQKVNRKATFWFGLFVLCIFILLINDLLTIQDVYGQSGFLAILLKFSNYLIAPFFYISINYYINPTQKWEQKDWFLFSFPIATIGLYIVYFLFKSPNQSEEDFFSSWFVLGFNIVFCLQLVPFFYFSHTKIIKHQNNIRLFSSSIENIDLKWLNHMVIGSITMACFWILNILTQISQISTYFDIIGNSIYLFGFLYIAYHFIKQKEIFPFNEIHREEIHEIISHTNSFEINKKKLVSDEFLEAYKFKLTEVMQNEKPYLDCELSLVKLASCVQLSSHTLSYVLNKGFDENFYQFVNRYRIEEAKKLLLDRSKSNLNLVGIAFEVGFNSKTVFNTTFKKMTNCTPTEFKRLHLLKKLP